MIRLAFAILRLEGIFSVLLNTPPSITHFEFDTILFSDDHEWDLDSFESLRESRKRSRTLFIYSDLVRIAMSKTGTLPKLNVRNYKIILGAFQDPIYRANRNRNAAAVRSKMLAARNERLNKEEELCILEINTSTEKAEREALVQSLEKWRHGFANVINPGANILNKNEISLYVTSLVLWHFSMLRLHADLYDLQNAAGRPEDHTQSLIRAKTYNDSQSIRTSLVHGVCIQKLVHDVLTGSAGIGISGLDIFVPIALFQAALVTWGATLRLTPCTRCEPCDGWLSNTTLNDDRDLSQFTYDSKEVMKFIDNGGRASIGGIPVCKCRIPELLSLFQQDLNCIGQLWGIGTQLSAVLANLPPIPGDM